MRSESVSFSVISLNLIIVNYSMVSMVRRLQMAGESFCSKLNTMVGILSFKVFQENNRANLIILNLRCLSELKLTGPTNVIAKKLVKLEKKKCFLVSPQ